MYGLNQNQQDQWSSPGQMEGKDSYFVWSLSFCCEEENRNNQPIEGIEERLMCTSTHQICKKEDFVWFPTDVTNPTDVQQHPWCVMCGTIQNLTDDRPKKEGYWMNMLGRIAEELRLTQVQKRLIAKEISKTEDLQDTFGTFGSAQQELFLSIVSKHVDISRLNVENLFYYK